MCKLSQYIDDMDTQMSDNSYDQQSNIEYQWHNFRESHVELKTDFCRALDTGDVKLLKRASDAALKALGGGRVGRPKKKSSIRPYVASATTYACAHVAREMNISFSEAWRRYFPDKYVPANPKTATDPADILALYCEAFAEVRLYIDGLINKQPILASYLQPLLPASKDREKK